MTAKLIAIQPGPMNKPDLVERAARLCYNSPMSETKEAQAAFLAKLMRKNHLSVAEHARYVFSYSGKDNPHEYYWGVRYGTNITGPNKKGDWAGDFIISWNARNSFDFSGYNPIILGGGDILNYNELSPAEKLAHASATFLVSGISRACSHQLVRHRVMSFSQESQRFVAAVDWEPVVPPSIQEHPDDGVSRVFHRFVANAKWDYRELRDSYIPKIPKQDARYILPNAAPTRLMITATFEHWGLFLEQRLPIAAQWEIRQNVAEEIHAALYEIEPGLFGDLGGFADGSGS